MFFLRVCSLFTLCVILHVNVSGNEEGKKSDRVADGHSVPHDIDGQHNPRYDEESLFGRDSPELPHDEAVENLARLFPKMDLDNDGYISREELTAWIQRMNSDSYFGEANRIWKDLQLKPDQRLEWEHYRTHVVGELGEYHDDDEQTRETNLKRDERRFKVAASDLKLGLTFEEAANFFAPELHSKMHDTLTLETIEELDKNNDSVIDLEEYTSDMWDPTDKNEETPEWVKTERDRFVQLDLDKDNKLNQDEVKSWLFPPQSEIVKTEVEHLFTECDTDRDMRLSKSELVDGFDRFTSSVATNYGDALTRHDEF